MDQTRLQSIVEVVGKAMCLCTSCVPEATDWLRELADVVDEAVKRASEADAALVRERAEHGASLAELGPPPVVDGRVLGGREAARAFREELDRLRVMEREMRQAIEAALESLEAARGAPGVGRAREHLRRFA